MVVYLDGVVGLNFLVDWILLLGVNRMSGFPPGIIRAAAAAMLGGGYAGLCLIPGFSFLESMLWRCFSLGMMSLTAFGFGRSALRRGILFVFLSMALGGLAISFGGGSFWKIPGCAGALGILCRMGFQGKAGIRRFLPVQIRHNGTCLSLTALEDTGNTLRDPVTGESVLVVDRRTAQQLLGLTPEALAHPAEAILQYPQAGFRLIPYQTVGQQGGFLLGLRCESVSVGKQRTGGLVAFAPVMFGNGAYSALTGG